ncbi:MAG: TRAM domain-containing protein, partial [Pirellulaceae bacterium]|nr:TRAM domain-containing protein [Pirellulaceae bacterium]
SVVHNGRVRNDGLTESEAAGLAEIYERRRTTKLSYRDMMERIRATVPDAAVSSDFIVGFCGETEEDFEQTIALVKECRFKNSFIFKYSERPGTKAADRIPDAVPYDVKQRRNNELLAVQNQISEEDNHEFLGRTVDVLVEGPSKASIKKGEDGMLLQLTGRTQCDRIVVFEGNRRLIGETIGVGVYDASSHTLFGTVVTQHAGPELFTVQ